MADLAPASWDCDFCLQTGAWRTLKLSGRKCQLDGIIKKLDFFFQHDISYKTIKDDPACKICLPCISKLENAYAFQVVYNWFHFTVQLQDPREIQSSRKTGPLGFHTDDFYKPGSIL